MSESSPPVEHRSRQKLQPSQLLVSARKLREVLAWWDADDPVSLLQGDPLPFLDPVTDVGLDPVTDVGLDPGVVADDSVVLADGHTRALAAVLSGVESVPVVRDPDRDSLSVDVYRTCVEWCLDEGVTEPAALVGRVVSHDTHIDEWVGRCRTLGDDVDDD